VLDKIVLEFQGTRAHPNSTIGLETLVYVDDIGALFLIDIYYSKLRYLLAVFIAYHIV